MIGKPIDLIVANSMHRCASEMEVIKSLVGAFKISEPEIRPAIAENVARLILQSLARDGRSVDVYAALRAVGAPCSVEDIHEGITAVLERAK